MELKNIKDEDPKIYKAIKDEEKRQNQSIELIASENYVSEAVLEAMGTVLTNKYSEGYPGARYYGGQEFVDVVEKEAIDKAKKLFGAEHANVQPYSGSIANAACYFAFLEQGGKFMGMSLAHGGHLTHGHPITFSGKTYDCLQYGVNKEGYLDYDEILKMAQDFKPKLIVSGASAYPREIDFYKFKEIADSVGALTLADISHISGLIIAGLHPSPFPFTDVVTTTTHKTLRGPRGAMILCKKEFAEKIDKAVFPGIQGGPLDHITAAKAVAFGEALEPGFKEYNKKILDNAQTLSFELMNRGFQLVSGGTDNHLMIIDLTNKEMGGRKAEELLDRCGITVNKNMIPYDKRKPFDPSGIRIGTPAVTTRGFEKDEMKKIADWIDRAIQNKENEEELAKIKQEVEELCLAYPIPGVSS